MSEEDIELKLLRLRKLRKLMALRTSQPELGKDERRSPIEELKAYLDERGAEILNEAHQLNSSLTERVAVALTGAVREGRLQPLIDAGDLLRLFRSLGLHVKPSTTVKVLKDGEVKDLRQYLSEE
ncbi:MAG: hypothetical protein NZ988_03305 [Thaumarchaeota archaeon]|nr:hypothetical protein [Candidatus Calditenuaceae archaeon]MDW8187059.1 hypothetical protein [Nitrososphaerota archaeon]